MNSFSERLRDLRKGCGLTQSNLGEMLGKSASAVGMWELGRNEPDMTTLNSLSSILGCSLEYLMCLDTSKNSTLRSPNDIPVYRYDADFPDDPLRYLTLPHEYFDGKSEYFGILYNNRDMTPSILPKDCVIIRKQDSALNGQIVLVRKTDGAVCLRKLLYQNGGVILKPLSLDFEPDFFASEFIDKSFIILGVAVLIERALE